MEINILYIKIYMTRKGPQSASDQNIPRADENRRQSRECVSEGGGERRTFRK